MTDIAHHHVAIAVMFIVAGHMYRTNWGIGHSIKEIQKDRRVIPCCSLLQRLTASTSS